jgi:glycosyltransferase involved in cell wall biosynthesis
MSSKEKPLNALILTPSYPSPDNPQAGIFIHRQMVHLARCGVRCRVLVYRPAPPPFPRWIIRRSWLRYYWGKLGWSRALDSVPVDTVFYDRRWIRDEDIVPAIGDAIIRHVESSVGVDEIEVVYAHFLWTGGAAALRLRERFGCPVVAIARGSEMHEWQESNVHCRPHVETVLRTADRVLANCEHLRNLAEAMVAGAASRIEVIYNGCDAEAFRPASDRIAAKRDLGFKPDSRLMLYCGYIEERKGISELIEAWRRFSANNSDWKLVLIGQPVDRNLESQLRKAGRSVALVGQVPHSRVIDYLKAADAYVQPSRLEGLANATMEAMSTGLPVITTSACGQRELIEDGANGWLVAAGDACALGEAMQSLAADPDRAKRMGEAARRTIENRFNPRREAARLAEILRETALAAAAR